MSLYPYQQVATEAIIHHFNSGSKFVILDAPPGTGKTFIGHAVMDRLSDHYSHSLYSCHSKALQRQFIGDFPDVAVMYGRSNYPTQYAPELSAADCLGKPGEQCPFCDVCAYRMAKDNFQAAPLGMTNISYFLAESNYVGLIDTSLIIVDEADKLEDALLGFAELSISERHLQLRYGISPPGKKTVQDSWLDWVQSAYSKIKVVQRDLNQRAAKEPVPELMKEVQYVNGLVSKLELLRNEELGIPSNNWVYDGYNDKMIKFKPIKVSTLADNLIWRHVDKALLMSGTVISSAVMADAVGIDNYEEVILPSRFPVENRPVIISPVAKMNKNSTSEDFDALAKEIMTIMDNHEGRILVHTVSYKYAQELTKRIRSKRIITYDNAQNIEKAIEKYLMKSDSVFIASSLSRGVSFSYDQCDVVVIVKVPYLSLGDKQVSARLYSPGGQVWYTVSAIRELVQMTGRGMRAMDDNCTTYILDGGFVDLYNKPGNKRFFPKWWRDAIRNK